MKNIQVIVYNVSKGSIAEEVGIEKGDEILKINNNTIFDIFDYRFLIANEYLDIEVKKVNDEIWDIQIEKDEYEDLGIEFENDLIQKEKSCSNKCIFCFIDQLPKGMRKTLYFKDDDARLSFLTGNYITMTNQTEDDLKRIVKYRMSPINISVHTTDDDLRCFMLGNKNAGGIKEKIEYLVKNGISVNCQIVLCPGINDGEKLIETLNDLAVYFPELISISIVPVGLTKYRDNLYKIDSFDSYKANNLINIIETYQKSAYNKFGSNLVFLADEFYIMANRKFPDYKHYESFPQIENGVGMVVQFEHEFYNAISEIRDFGKSNLSVSIITGESMFFYMKKLCLYFESKFKGTKINLYKIKNHFFGEKVTVTGLLTGTDIINQLKNEKLDNFLLLCDSMLKDGNEMFLDDYTINDVEKVLNTTVIKVGNNGCDFINKLNELVIESK